MQVFEGRPDGAGKRVAVVATRWNEFVVKELLDGALDELRRSGDPEVVVVRVPGSWEVPPAVAALLETGGWDAVVVVGCILQGATHHAEQLAGDVAGALMAMQNAYGVPIGWAVLTPEDAGQAMDRAGLKMGNKGREAVLAALEAADLLGQLRAGVVEPED